MSTDPVERSRIRELLAKAVLPRGKPAPTGISADELKAFSKRTGIQVPRPLAEWLEIANGACVSAGGLFGIYTKRKHVLTGIEEIYDLHPEWKQRGWIPLASDGCGNYYIMPTAQEFGRGWPVFLFDMAEAPEGSRYIVASNIWKFLLWYLEMSISDEYLSGWLFDRDQATQRDPDLETFEGLAMPWDA